jgi:SAM-dependent methyltransferase
VTALADAYARGAAAWAATPSLVYGPLAELLVAFSPEPVDGRLMLEVGSGTGVGSLAALAAGARVIASDVAPGMLLLDRERRPAAVAADAQRLPFRDDAFDIVLAPFSLNHLPDPAAGVREAGRVGRLLLGSTYAEDDDHPVKAAVEQALRTTGWEPPEWYTQLKSVMRSWGTVGGATEAIERGGLTPVRVERIEVQFDTLTPADLVGWRLGLAHTSSAFATLPPARQREVTERALELLGPDSAPLVRRVIFLAAAHQT